MSNLRGGDSSAAADIHLPDIRSNYYDSFGGNGGYISQSRMMDHDKWGKGQEQQHYLIQGIRNEQTARFDQLEGRIASQERSSQALLDRSVHLKEDVIENLNLARSAWQGEKRQREQLQEQMRFLDALVKKVDQEIRTLENQIKMHEAELINLRNESRATQLQQASNFTDVRGRIARCDGAISKIASDQRGFQDSLKKLTVDNAELQKRLTDRIQSVELKLVESTQKLERTQAELSLKSQRVGNEKNEDYTLLESKIRSLEELRLQVTSSKTVEVIEKERLENKLMIVIDKSINSLQDKLENTEKKLQEALVRMEKTIYGSQQQSSMAYEKLKSEQEELEKRMTAMVTHAMEQQGSHISRLKQETREGLSSVHDSIAHSKNVLEGKLALSEEQMRKEVAHIKKMVVLI